MSNRNIQQKTRGWQGALEENNGTSDIYGVSYDSEQQTDSVTYRGAAGRQAGRQLGLTEPAVTAPHSDKPLKQPTLIFSQKNKHQIPPKLQQAEHEGWKEKIQMAGKPDRQPEEVESAHEDLSEYDTRLREIWKERR